MTQVQAQAAGYRIGNDWHAGLDVEYDGVNMADAIAYEVIRILGMILLRNLERHKGDGRSDTDTNT